MTFRTKVLLAYALLGVAPLLLYTVVQQFGATRAAESRLRAALVADADRTARDLATKLDEREADVRALARSLSLNAKAGEADRPRAQSTNSDAQTTNFNRDEIIKAAAAFLAARPGIYTGVTCFGADGRALVRVEPPLQPGGTEARVKTDEFLLPQTPVDGRVWSLMARPTGEVLRAPVALGPTGALLRLTAPVLRTNAVTTDAGAQLDEAASHARPAAALVVEVNLAPLFRASDAANGATAGGARAGEEARNAATVSRDPEVVANARIIVVLARDGRIAYHSNDALKYQPAGEAMAYFAPVTARMTAGGRGADFYRDPANAHRWLAAYRPLDGLDLSFAVAADETASGVYTLSWFGLAFAAAFAVVGGVVLTLTVNRAARRVARVAAAANALSDGDLQQRLELRPGDETSDLVESFNRMTDRLREQVARETESRQFQSFIRLSAMLTHDLKNSITGLSMLVSNMERQFHREEFRADAISSLREATDKLRALVARLSEPVKTLSGEYRRVRGKVDLVPLVRRAFATTAEPSAALYELDLRLPEQLIAVVDAERAERVFENLIVNALEAMGALGGRLTVVAGRENADYVFVSVADTGVGMSDEFIRTRLFRAFATTKKTGIGLGLYTCREIVETHGGRLEVESREGAGTCFRVVLPSTPISSQALNIGAHSSASERINMAR